jgi:hypothetical protein
MRVMAARRPTAVQAVLVAPTARMQAASMERHPEAAAAAGRELERLSLLLGRADCLAFRWHLHKRQFSDKTAARSA